MFGPDPIDIFDPSPYGALPYYGHYILGSLVLIAALTAFAVRKGKGTHRTAGLIYIAGVALLSITSFIMLSFNFIPPLLMAAITAIYAIGGAYLALQPGSLSVRLGEYGLFVLEIAGLAVFLSIAVPAARMGAIPVFAPAVIAIIPLILLIGDANWFLRPQQRAKRRVARHMSRMIWAFVVVVRAPMVELAAAGAPISQPLTVFGPILLAIAMLWYFQRKYGGSPFGRRMTSTP